MSAWLSSPGQTSHMGAGNNPEQSRLRCGPSDEAPPMRVNTTDQHPAALDRITLIANEIASAHPRGDALVREVFALSHQLIMAEGSPKPIESAPRRSERKLLLYCPDQGGWQVGEWTGERWVLTWTWDFLTPTHWTEAPGLPGEP